MTFDVELEDDVPSKKPLISPQIDVQKEKSQIIPKDPFGSKKFLISEVIAEEATQDKPSVEPEVLGEATTIKDIEEGKKEQSLTFWNKIMSWPILELFILLSCLSIIGVGIKKGWLFKK